MNTSQTETQKQTPPAQTQNQAGRPPAGYVEESGDIVGFWDPEQAPIHFVPRTVRLFDSTIDASKPGALLFGELIDPTIVNTPGEDSVPAQAKKGDMVGIWLKPGMKALAQLGGVPVYMLQDGELDTGKPNPMKTFKILRKARGTALIVEADYRVRSKGAPLPVPVQIMQPAPADGPPPPF